MTLTNCFEAFHKIYCTESVVGEGLIFHFHLLDSGLSLLEFHGKKAPRKLRLLPPPRYAHEVALSPSQVEFKSYPTRTLFFPVFNTIFSFFYCLLYTINFHLPSRLPFKRPCQSSALPNRTMEKLYDVQLCRQSIELFF